MALPVIAAFSRIEQLVWQLWTLGATKEVCSQLLSVTEFPNAQFATVWHRRCTELLGSQLAAKYNSASMALATGGSGGSALGALVQPQQEGSSDKSPTEL